MRERTGVAAPCVATEGDIGESPRIQHLRAELEKARWRKRKAAARLYAPAFRGLTLDEQADVAEELSVAAAQVAGFARMLAKELKQA
jgi:hypothetical protein